MKARKESTRTCVGCGESFDKRQLLRVLRSPEGHVEVDTTGKGPGRGAYLCCKAECFESARKRRRLDSHLKVSLRDDDYDRLRRDFDAACSPRDAQ